MKIKGVNVNKLDRISGGRVSRSKSQEGPRAGSAPRDDVSLSPNARAIGQAKQAVANSPDIRMERVQPIREALAAGRYSVSSLDIADKILRQVLSERKQAV